MKAFLLGTTALFLATQAYAADLLVGADKPFHTVCSAIAAAAQSGDRILVNGGTYTNEGCGITKTDLALIAVGGRALMLNAVNHNIPNGKGIFVTNGNISFSGFAWQGAKVADGNGAGIRHESGNLLVEGGAYYGWFSENQNGILAGDPPTGKVSTVTVRSMAFDHNGVGGDGHTHNIYVNHINNLTMQNVCSSRSNIGHELKSRAAVTDISGSWFQTFDGNGSYEMDFPNGGVVKLSNVFVQQGQNSGNPNMIAYGEEGITWPTNSLNIDAFVLVNDKSSGTGVWNNSTVNAQLTNGQYYQAGSFTIVNGPNTQTNVQRTTTRPGPTPCG
jgi:hypothetical protein